MLTFDYTPGLTKEKILSLVTEQEIIEAFLGSKINFKAPILSPFREEKTPSFTFKKINNKIIFRDWGSGLCGDAFSFVQQLYSCSFTEVLYLINNKLNLNLTDTTVNLSLAPKIIMEHEHQIKNNETIIEIQKQIFTAADYRYWNQYNISLQTLQFYNVFSCKYFWLNKQLIGSYSANNPMYAYQFICEHKERYKIYRPYAGKKEKWMCNITPQCVEGFDQLNLHGEIIILTKSMKDVMCLRELGFDAFSLHGESNVLSNDLYNNIARRYARLVVLYDNDTAGMSNSAKICKQYNLQNIIIPLNSKAKDISDFIMLHGANSAKKLLLNLLTNEQN